MSNKKRIAKNALFLYIRMLFNMGIALFTSRLVLQNLGVNDYGIFSVVGGIAVLFSFFNNALNASTQRFLNIAISQKDDDLTKLTFSMSMNCHIIISLLIIFFAETIGLWFLNTQLNIASESMYAANWVYQFSLLSCVLGILNVPYTGTVIAYEKMSFFAIVSIFVSVLKLIIACLIVFASERLIIYSGLLFATSVISFMVNRIYCYRNFSTCRYLLKWDKLLFKEMFSFTGWNIIKSASIMGVVQGNNILVNIFGGTTASAAMGIANQVNGVTYGFMENVQSAYNPQITQTVYQRNEKEYNSLIEQSSKFSSFLFALVGIPVVLNIDTLLSLWLTVVPDDTSVLCIWLIVSTYLVSLTGPLNTAIYAVGDIKSYQIWTSLIWFLAIPVAYILLRLGMPFKYIVVAKVLSQIIIVLFSIWHLAKRITFPCLSFLRSSAITLAVFIIATVASFYLPYLIGNKFLGILLSTLACWLFLIVGMYMFNFKSAERKVINNILKSKLHVNIK